MVSVAVAAIDYTDYRVDEVTRILRTARASGLTRSDSKFAYIDEYDTSSRDIWVECDLPS